MPTDAAALLAAKRAFVVAPAGCGKTELIAQAVRESPGKSLILTHTHAGVNALRHRLQRLGVRAGAAEVHTIDGFALRCATAYPTTSGLSVLKPTGADWADVRSAGVRVLKSRAVREAVEASFEGVFVDEYQDCSLAQHSLVLELASLLPCRVLGDPLQAIFDFKEATVSWQDHVLANFSRLPDLTTPHRWRGKNEKLGRWLLDQRPALAAGGPISLAGAPVRWLASSEAARRSACFTAARAVGESVVALAKWPAECHKLASQMRGVYTSMEELDCSALMEFAKKVDRAATGPEKSVALLEFAFNCFTELSTRFSSALTCFRQGSHARAVIGGRNHVVVNALNELAVSNGLAGMIYASRALEGAPPSVLYRRELWTEMKTTLLTAQSGGASTIEESAWLVRDRARRFGRRAETRVISRTLLVKGLEFDHSVVLSVDAPNVSGRFNAKEFYVAATRGSRTLTVCSASEVLRFSPVANSIVDFRP